MNNLPPEWWQNALGENLIDACHIREFSAEDFRKISTDSRTVESENWFLALKGESFDGHQFLSDAVTKNVKGCISEEKLQKSNQDTSQIIVKDSELAFQQLAEAYLLSAKNLKRIAITGSVGKTTAKNLIHSIFAAEKNTVSTPKSFNNEVGVPKTIQLFSDETEYGVFEIAARRRGDIKLLTEMLHPHIRICLNAGRSHIGEFGSEEAIFSTKSEIFEKALPDDVFIYPADDERFENKLASAPQKKITFGFSDQADVRICQTDDERPGMRVSYQFKNKTYTCHFPNWHTGHQINGAVALACAVASESVELEKACASLSTSQQENGRFEIVPCTNGLTFINDCYNSSPQSMSAGIESLSHSYHHQTKVLILGDMLELGEDSEKLHKDLANKIQLLENVKRIISIGNFSQHFVPEGFTNHEHFENITQFINHVTSHNLSLEGVDVLYLKSSLGIGLFPFANKWVKELEL